MQPPSAELFRCCTAGPACYMTRMNLRFLLPLIFCASFLTPLSLFSADRPNVVIIYGDDVGYADVGAYGSRLIPTPHLDKLAAAGLRFTDGHCTAATCSPSRFSLLTGIHAFRHNVRILAPNSPMAIPLDKLTLPKLFKKAGYNCAVIGKWHLGIGDGKTPNDWNGDVKPGPLEVGFDYSFLLPYTNDRVPCVYLENYRVVNLDPQDPISIGKEPLDPRSTIYPDGKKTPEAMTYYRSSHGHNSSVINGIGRIGYMTGGKSALWNDETMADEFVRQARKWMSKQTEDRPFFIFFSSQDIHVPRTPHPRFHGKTRLGYRGDAMVQLDWSAGAVVAMLEEFGFAENTMVIFSSDNGPVYDDGYQDGTVVKTSSQEVDQGHDGSGPYRGGKYQIYEGGTRVPFIIKWPKKISAGTTSDALVSQVDLLASFAAMLDIELQPGEAIDSRNTLDAFLGKSDQGVPYLIEEAGSLALREGDWKFVRSGGKGKRAVKKGQLYNLAKDVAEKNNLIEAHSERAEKMREKLKQLVESDGIRMVAVESGVP